MNVGGRGFGSCGFVVAGRNASNSLAGFLRRIFALERGSLSRESSDVAGSVHPLWGSWAALPFSS